MRKSAGNVRQRERQVLDLARLYEIPDVLPDVEDAVSVARRDGAGADAVGEEMNERDSWDACIELLERLDERARCRARTADEDVVAGPDDGNRLGGRDLAAAPVCRCQRRSRLGTHGREWETGCPASAHRAPAALVDPDRPLGPRNVRSCDPTKLLRDLCRRRGVQGVALPSG